MDEILIEKVREHDILYNVKLSDYRDKHIRQTAWVEIAKELNISAIEAKERWEKLRRSFCNAKSRRREDTKSGMATKKKNFWKYELQMEFLTPFIEDRKTQNSVKKSQDSVNLTTEAEDILSEGSNTEETTLFKTENEQGDQSNEGEDVASVGIRNDENRYETIKAIQNKKRKKLTDSPVYQMVQILKETSDLRKRKYAERKKTSKPSTVTSGLETLDDMDMFFMSMSRMTKKLPKVEQTKIKIALSNLVLTAEAQNQQNSFHQFQETDFDPLQEQSCSSTPSRSH